MGGTDSPPVCRQCIRLRPACEGVQGRGAAAKGGTAAGTGGCCAAEGGGEREGWSTVGTVVQVGRLIAPLLTGVGAPTVIRAGSYGEGDSRAGGTR